MASRIKSGDVVRIIAGAKKGTTGKVVSVHPKKGTLKIEGVGERHRHIRPSQHNPMGGSKDIHVGIDASKVALVIDEKGDKTSRVGYKKDSQGDKLRVARQHGGKEIK